VLSELRHQAFALARLEPLSAGQADGDGGPIRRDRTFFALAAEQEHARDAAAAPVDALVLEAVNRFLGQGGLPGLTTRYLAPSVAGDEETEASAKLNHQLSSRHGLMLRYSYFNDRRTGEAFGANALTDASARGSIFARDHGRSRNGS
jgi:hypothetical protein